MDQRISDLVVQQFSLDPSKQFITEEDLLQALTEQVHFMIDNRLELLLSLLYRMDISESKINQMLSPASPIDADRGLAILILERQKQRLLTKMTYQSEDPDFWSRDL